MFGPPLAAAPMDILLDGQDVAAGIQSTFDAFGQRGGRLVQPRVTRLEAIDNGQCVRIHLEGTERTSNIRYSANRAALVYDFIVHMCHVQVPPSLAHIVLTSQLNMRDIIAALGVKIVDSPVGEVIEVGPTQVTSVAGVYAAGDCATPMKAVPVAMSTGATAAAMVSRELSLSELGL